MYAWIWRHLPFGRWGKIVGSLLLTGIMVTLLWYIIFPWAEPLLPFDDVQVTDGGGGVPGDLNGGDPDGTGVEGEPGDEHDLPYSTESNNPVPTPTGGR